MWSAAVRPPAFLSRRKPVKINSNNKDKCMGMWRTSLPHICVEMRDADVGHPAFVVLPTFLQQRLTDAKYITLRSMKNFGAKMEGRGDLPGGDGYFSDVGGLRCAQDDTL